MLPGSLDGPRSRTQEAESESASLSRTCQLNYYNKEHLSSRWDVDLELTPAPKTESKVRMKPKHIKIRGINSGLDR